MLYAFDLLMVRGYDVRLWPLEDRRHQLSRNSSRPLPDVIRYSETFSVSLAELERAVTEHRLEEIVAKRVGNGGRFVKWLLGLYPQHWSGQSLASIRPAAFSITKFAYRASLSGPASAFISRWELVQTRIYSGARSRISDASGGKRQSCCGCGLMLLCGFAR